MTTPSGLTEKRKLESVTSDDYSLQGGPNQKLIKRSSTERASDIFFQKPSPTSERDDDEDDDDDDDNDDDFSEMNDFLHKEDPSNHSHQQGQRPDQQQQKGQEQPQPQSQLPPQRKKPGRKPNPASPALRKAQNRAAQRAFRERKERHLRDLEDTIKDLRERAEKYHSLIAHLESENSYWKKVAFYFECALNKNNGNNDATTKLKNFLALTLPSRSTAPSFLFNGGRAAVGQINPPFGLEAMQMRQPSLPSHQVPTAQQLQNNCLDLLQTSMGVNCDALSIINVPSPASSSVLMSSPNGSTTISTASVSSASSPLTPESVIAESISPSSTFLVEEFAREMTIADMKPFINPTPSIQISHEPSYVSSNVYNSSIASMYKAAIRTSSKSNSTSSTVSTASSSSDDTIASTNPSSFVDETVYNNGNDMFLDFLDDQGFEEFSNFDFDGSDVISNITEKGLSKEEQQVLRLSKKMGQSVVGPVYPKVKHPLTEEQLYYLSLGHDRRIDMIPCLHLRSRMIQYHDQYDLDELIELLIEHAKCHGDPLDPDSWELPDEFFDRYDLLVFQQCRIKSNLYKQFGHLPKDFLIT